MTGMHALTSGTVPLVGRLITELSSEIGLIPAATITQMPYIEKIITPYILLLVTTPMIREPDIAVAGSPRSSGISISRCSPTRGRNRRWWPLRAAC